jgi:L-lysine 6-transaminase
MVRCARYLEIMEEDDLVATAARVGDVFRAQLERLASDFSTVVGNVRGRGLLLAFDLPDTKTRDEIRQHCWDRGFATLPCGPRSIRFRPSLIFSEQDVEKGIGILRQVLAD